jgi:hypothetical protein
MCFAGMERNPERLGDDPLTAAEVAAFVEAELAAFPDARVVAAIRRHMIAPRVEMRPWDYGAAEDRLPCWIVLDGLLNGVVIAYCEQGFGPAKPWGLLWSSACDEETESDAMGMDFSWFCSLAGAFLDTWSGGELPIWRVGRMLPDGGWEPTGPEMIQDEAEAEAARLNALDSERRLFAWHGLEVY